MRRRGRKRATIDTNVPIVANGPKDVALSCRLAAVEFLEAMLVDGCIVLDSAGEIQEEYHRYLQPSGQPGVGDRFYLQVLNSAPERITRVDLPKNADGSYVDFPTASELAKFDRSDRKFAALARRERIPVATAIDSDWLDYRAALEVNGITVYFVCGANPTKWFTR